MTPNLQDKGMHLLSADVQELTLSILIPFEPKITAKTKIEASIRRMVEQAEKKLFQQLQKQPARMILAHLHEQIAQLDYSTHKKSLVLVANSREGKAYYWNMPVQETLLIGSEFPVRELLARRTEEKTYLLLAMADHYASIFLGNDRKLNRLVANSPAPAYRPVSLDAASAAQTTCRADLQRAVRHIDDALAILLRSYKVPVFIAAPPAYVECFKQISRNSRDIAAYIEATPDGSASGLEQLMAPKLADWKSIKERGLLQQLDDALQSGKLAVGMGEVWNAAAEKRGRLLVVEEGYTFPAYLDAKEGILYADAIPLNQTAYAVNDAVASTIEKVMADGGQVEVVRTGTLQDYVHIAMICY